VEPDAAMVLGLVGVLALAMWAAWRANEVFRIRITAGKVEIVRGRPPGGFVDDVKTIASHVERGTIRAVKRSNRPTLVCEGLDERTAQRLVNTFSTYVMSVHRGRAGSRL
jgi:hypothetical protein